MNPRGTSLIETLVALAIVGGLIGTVAVTAVGLGQQLQMNESLRESEQLRVYVQGLMDQPAICGKALRGTDGQPLKWIHSQENVGQIMGASAQTPALKYSQPFGRVSQIVSIYVRDPFANEGGPAGSTLTVGAATFRTRATKLVIITQPRSALSVGPAAQISRTIDVALTLDPSNVVRACASASNVTPVNGSQSFICGPDTVTPGQNHCQNTTDFFCTQLYVITGFGTAGRPICACQPSCYAGPEGPTGSGSGSGVTSSTPPDDGNTTTMPPFHTCTDGFMECGSGNGEGGPGGPGNGGPGNDGGSNGGGDGND